MARDSQRSRVYKAEGRFWSQHECGKEQMSLDECVAYVEKITRTAWWKKRANRHRVRSLPKVKDGRGRRSAAASRPFWTIWLPRAYRDKATILHELAHLLVKPTDQPPHGREFCAIYLELVKRFIGPEAAKGLKAEFKNGRAKTVRSAKS
jgi:putative metallohydrolase (TIGR04338 family)